MNKIQNYRLPPDKFNACKLIAIRQTLGNVNLNKNRSYQKRVNIVLILNFVFFPKFLIEK